MKSIADLLRRSAERVPDKAALLLPSGERVTYRALDREADAVARGLVARGVQKGDRVALAMHNVREFPSSYVGIIRAGGIAVPLNVLLTEQEVAKILHDCGARVVIGAPPFVEVVRRAGALVPSVEHVVSTDEGAFGDDSTTLPEVAWDESDVAVLAYTSGTTGHPRGAMLTHGNLLANLRQQMEVPEDEITEDDVLLLALPLFHIFGLNVTLGLLIMNGASGLLIERFDPGGVLQLMQEHRVTVVFGAPPMYAAWASAADGSRYDLSSVRIAVSGAAPLPVEVLRRFKDIYGIDIYEGYGMTETAPTLTSSRMAEAVRAGSVGKPLPGVDLRLVDENGHRVELGDPGEILVRGPNVFKGYWNRAEESAQSFSGEWFHTGDVAVQDEDGYIYLVDRKRDLIIVSGFNVFPSEVENALLQNPKVEEAAVIGAPHPYTGEAVKAYVVLRAGETATEKEMKSDLQTRLARFKCPDSIELVASLPHLATGKVLRRALRT